MKIIRIIARLNVGGPARQVVWLTEALQDDEFTSLLISGTVPAGEEDMCYFADEHGVEPIFIAEMSRELSPKDIISLIKVYRILRSEKPDIVHSHTAKAGTIGRAAAFAYRWLTWGTLIGRPRRVRVVHTFHGHVFHSYYGNFKTRIFVFIEKLLARFATDKIVVITGQQLREICEETGVGRRAQFEMIPLGIDLTEFDQNSQNATRFKEEIGVSENELLIGFVGRLTEIKNIPMFLNSAAAFLTSPDAPPARFVIVGDGHLRAELERAVIELGISEKISFAGNRSDTAEIYSSLDIVALTSLNEGTPLSLIEAMAAGRPVISTAVGGVVDLLGEGQMSKQGFMICERGISAHSGDVDEFCKGLIYLAKNERLRMELGRSGRAFIIGAYSKGRLVTDIKKLYRQLN